MKADNMLAKVAWLKAHGWKYITPAIRRSAHAGRASYQALIDLKSWGHPVPDHIPTGAKWCYMEYGSNAAGWAWWYGEDLQHSIRDFHLLHDAKIQMIELSLRELLLYDC